MTGHPQEFDPLLLLQRGVSELGLTLPPQAPEQFRIYLQELQRWNARVNLTALKTERDIIIKHFLDSLAVLPYLGNVASLADLGSGPGFPGLVLKLAQPDMNLTLVEARAKKAAFLQYLVSLLHLERVEVAQIHLTPTLARQWGPQFHAVTSRAAFPLIRVLEIAAPLLLPGGRILALKGPNLPAPELDTARKRSTSLDLTSLEVQPYLLPLSQEPRLLVLARRI